MNTTAKVTIVTPENETCINSVKPDLGLYFLEHGFVVEILIIVFSIYLLVAFIIHGKRCRMLVSKSKKDMHRGLVYKFALVTILIPFLRYGSTLSYILSGRFCYGALCELSADVGYVMLMCSITTTYSFLWIRQRVFYGHPSLCDRYGRCLVYFSKFVLIPIVLEAIAAVAVAVSPVEYTAMDWQCTPIVHQSDPLALVYAALMVLTQTLLLGLFLHPVVSHMKIQRRVSHNGGAAASEPTYSRDDSYTDSSCSKYTAHDPGRPSADLELSSTEYQAYSSSENHEESTKHEENSEVSEADTMSQGTDEAQKSEATRKPRSKSAPDLYRTAVTNTQKMVLARSTTFEKKSNLSVASSKRTRGRVMTTLRNKRDALKQTVRNTRSTVRSRGRVMMLIKRTVYLCVICILSDFSASIINTVGWDVIAQGMQFVIYDISLLINVITVIASFENFRKMLIRPIKCWSTKSRVTRESSRPKSNR